MSDPRDEATRPTGGVIEDRITVTDRYRCDGCGWEGPGAGVELQRDPYVHFAVAPDDKTRPCGPVHLVEPAEGETMPRAEAIAKPSTPSERLRRIEASFQRDPKLYPVDTLWLINRAQESIQDGEPADDPQPKGETAGEAYRREANPQPTDASRAIAEWHAPITHGLLVDAYQVRGDALVKALVPLQTQESEIIHGLHDALRAERAMKLSFEGSCKDLADKLTRLERELEAEREMTVASAEINATRKIFTETTWAMHEADRRAEAADEWERRYHETVNANNKLIKERDRLKEEVMKLQESLRLAGHYNLAVAEQDAKGDGP